MDMEAARSIHAEIEESALAAERRALYQAAVRYAHIRSRWFLLSQEERRESSQGRTIAHNALIDACNIFAREMRERGEDDGWRREIGDSRQEIGDFACYLSCLLGLGAR